MDIDTEKVEKEVSQRIKEMRCNLVYCDEGTICDVRKEVMMEYYPDITHNKNGCVIYG